MLEPIVDIEGYLEWQREAFKMEREKINSHFFRAAEVD